MLLISNFITNSKEKFEFLQLARFSLDDKDPLTKKTFRARAQEVPTAGIGYLFAIEKNNIPGRFNLTKLDGLELHKKTIRTEQNVELSSTSLKIYWYFMSSVGQTAVYYLGSNKSGENSSSNSEQECFRKAAEKDPDALIEIGYKFYYGTENFPMNRPLAIACIHEAAELGQAEALYLRGTLRLNRKIPIDDSNKGLEDIKSAALKNHPQALFALGEFAEKGIWLPQSDADAYNYYQDAMNNKSSEACLKLGRFYAFGKSFHQQQRTSATNWLDAFYAFRRGAQLGNVEAMVHVARLFECNPYLPNTPELSAKYRFLAAKAGCQQSKDRLEFYQYYKDKKPSLADFADTKATATLADVGTIKTHHPYAPPEYNWGEYRPLLDEFDQYVPNEKKTKTILFRFEDLAKLPDSSILLERGVYNLQQAGIRVNLEEVFPPKNLLSPLAETRLQNGVNMIILASRLKQGTAYFLLGHLMINGLIAPSGDWTPFKYFEKAAELQSSRGAFALAQCYNMGFGTKKSNELYFKYLEIAADKKHPFALCARAQHALEDSKKVKDNSKMISEALDIIRRLAEVEKFHQAQYVLGEMFFNGEFLPVSIEKALFWFREAMRSGSLAAKDRLEEIANSTTKKEPTQDALPPPKRKRGRPKATSSSGSDVDTHNNEEKTEKPHKKRTKIK